MDNELVTLAQLARRLKVSQSWVKAEAEAGRVPCLWAGGRLLFSSAAVKQALLERAQKAQGVDHAN